MQSVSLEKSLCEEVSFIRLDERAVYRLAERVSALRNKYRQSGKDSDARRGWFTAKIVSMDGEDTYKTDRCDFLLEPGMPRQIRSIELHSEAYSESETNISCWVDLDTAAHSIGARIHVSGTDADAVVSIFRELKRELTSYQLPCQRLLQAIRGYNFLFFYSLGLICSLAAFSLFDIALQIAAKNISGLAGSDVFDGLQIVGWLWVFIVFVEGPGRILDILRRAFPPVQFAGSLADSGARDRSRVKWIAGAVVLPIVLELFLFVLFRYLD